MSASSKGADVSSEIVAAVAIGRNEGERLRNCLTSLRAELQHVVYVDSGSTDGSVEVARRLGVHVVELDLSVPFTAARARNAGLRYLRDNFSARFVQFVDGDCEVERGWIEHALEFLTVNPEAAVVFGRRRERFPERSVYNRLCDAEWHQPAGRLKSCGGDAMMRVDALDKVGGYRSDLIAGEEPELCVRLRQAGWQIWCVDRPMTLHDAAMTSFAQWWRRNVRAGYAFVQGSRIHGRPPERHWVRETWRARIWGIALPVAIALGALFVTPYALLLALIYPAQVIRLYLKHRWNDPTPFSTSFFQVLGKFPEAIGQIKFEYDRLAGRKGTLIEYK